MNGYSEYATTTTTTTLESLGLTPTPPEPLTGVVVGILTGISERGEPLVNFPGSPSGIPGAARATVSLTADHAGREVALMFEGGDPHRPLIIGLIQHPGPPSPTGLRDASVAADGKRTVISAEEEIELRCGKASIILTKAGKVIIRGAYLLSRSSGVNRIKGGSVQIN